MLPYTTDTIFKKLNCNNDQHEYYNEILNNPSQISNKYFNMTPSVMWEYLQNKPNYVCSLALSYPKAVQKSYKTEKRFFCPPPALELNGLGWDRIVKNIKSGYGTSNTRFDPQKDIKINVQVTNTSMNLSSMDMMPMSRSTDSVCYFLGKQLYISDGEKKKMLSLNIDINLLGNKLGDVSSDRMKVVSKPSKKKQTVLGADANFILIRSSTRIALYNRLRCQTISTRFLHVQNSKYLASAQQWSIFDVYLVSDEKDNTLEFNYEEGYLCYGQSIRLVDVVSGVALPKMTIRRVSKEKNVYQVIKNNGEPVSQLHMCAFELIDNNGKKSFLYASNENIICDTEKSTNESDIMEIRDGARWTIASAEYIKHSFAPMGNGIMKPITPFPRVNIIKDDEFVDGEYWIELEGENLTNDFKVWFGTLEAPKHQYRSRSTLACMVPLCIEFFKSEVMKLQNSSPSPGNVYMPVPITIVRNDGVIFETNFMYKFNEREAGRNGNIIKSDFFNEQKTVYDRRIQNQQHIPRYSGIKTDSVVDFPYVNYQHISSYQPMNGYFQ